MNSVLKRSEYINHSCHFTLNPTLTLPTHYAIHIYEMCFQMPCMFWHMHPAKAWIWLHICLSWQEPSFASGSKVSSTVLKLLCILSWHTVLSVCIHWTNIPKDPLSDDPAHIATTYVGQVRPMDNITFHLSYFWLEQILQWNINLSWQSLPPFYAFH